MTSFMDVLKAGGDVLKAAGDLGLELVKEAGRGAATAAKWAGNAAMDAMCTSSEDSELTYRYDGDCTSNWDCRKVMGRALVDLAVQRPRDSYIQNILFHCSNVDLSGPTGKLVGMISRDEGFRSQCRKFIAGDAVATQWIEKFSERNKLPKETVIVAVKSYDNLFAEGKDYSAFVEKVFVAYVGKEIRESVRDDDGKLVQDADGRIVERIVGTDYSVAQFTVTFSSSQKIKLKVYLNGGSWESLKSHSHTYI